MERRKTSIAPPDKPSKIAEFNLQFEMVNFEEFDVDKIIEAEQEIPEIGAKCLLEVTPRYYDSSMMPKYYSKCIVTIEGLCEEFQLSGKYKIRIICNVGDGSVFNKEKAITSASIRTGNSFIDLNLLLSKVLANGSLIFDVSVELYALGQVCNVFSNPIKNYKLLAENIGRMLQSTKFSDFTFIVKGQEFKVHRNILAQASSVFAALFETDMEEAQSKKCVIKEIEPNIFLHLLHYIYTLELPQDLASASKELYEAAHYYEVTELKDICLLHVSSTLTVENAMERFYWSLKYDEDLKMKAWKIIKRDILKIFVTMKQEPPSVLLLQQMLQHQKMSQEFWKMQIEEKSKAELT